MEGRGAWISYNRNRIRVENILVLHRCRLCLLQVTMRRRRTHRMRTHICAYGTGTRRKTETRRRRLTLDGDDGKRGSLSRAHTYVRTSALRSNRSCYRATTITICRERRLRNGFLSTGVYMCVCVCGVCTRAASYRNEMWWSCLRSREKGFSRPYTGGGPRPRTRLVLVWHVLPRPQLGTKRFWYFFSNFAKIDRDSEKKSSKFSKRPQCIVHNRRISNFFVR